MLNKKVIHTNAAIGEGTIVKFENNIVTVEFSDKIMNFRYPDVFAKFLRLADEDAQSEVKALADEAIAEKAEIERAKAIAKADEIRRLYARFTAAENKNRRLSAAELKNKEHGNLAFKNNFCDGGASDASIGFKHVCSPEQIRRNVEMGRAWCSNENSPCGRFYRGEISYDELLAIHNGGFVCYESKLLVEWKSEAGDDVKEGGVHKSRRITGAKNNSLAILTTELPGSSERIIFAVFITGTVDEGDALESGYVKADPAYTIELTPDEARHMLFWNYHKNTDGGTRWSQGLYRYISNDSCVRILEDIVKFKQGDEKAHAEKVLAQYRELKGIDNV